MADRDPGTLPPTALPPGGRPYSFTAAEFVRMVGDGYFLDRNVELVAGEIRELNSIHNPHRLVQTDLLLALQQAIPRTRSGGRLIFEPMVEFDDHTIRQPDICVLNVPRPVRRTHVLPHEVALAVEVADTSLDRDLGEKLAYYARVGIARYWVVDISDGLTHDFAEPHGSAYARHAKVPFGEPLPLAPIADATITIPPGGYD